jgi:hypothetical protein
MPQGKSILIGRGTICVLLQAAFARKQNSPKTML